MKATILVALATLVLATPAFADRGVFYKSVTCTENGKRFAGEGTAWLEGAKGDFVKYRFIRKGNPFDSEISSGIIERTGADTFGEGSEVVFFDGTDVGLIHGNVRCSSK